MASPNATQVDVTTKPNSPYQEMSVLSVPPPSIGAGELHKGLVDAHASLAPEDQAKYATPGKPSGGILADTAVRRIPPNGTQLQPGETGVTITNNDYERRANRETGQYARKGTDSPSDDLAVTTYQKSQDPWGVGEKSGSCITSRDDLPKAVAKVESDIKTGEVDRRFTYVVEKNAETGRPQSVPIGGGPEKPPEQCPL